MATESSSPNQVENKALSDESAKAVEAGGAPETKGDVTQEKNGNWPFANSEPMREDQVQNAVKFLSHPKVQGSPIMYRRSFLERKGLTKEEIDEAFRRVPDPPTQELPPRTTVPSQERQSMPNAPSQTQVPLQALQQSTGTPVTASTAMVEPSRFHWTNMLLGLGLLTAAGAGTGVVFKKSVIPRFKSWICQIVSESNESEQQKVVGPSPVEEAVVAAKVAATAAAEVANASREMLKSKLEDSKNLEGMLRSLEEQVKEMKSMKVALRDIEKHRSEHINGGPSDEQITSGTNKGKSNSPWEAVSSVNQLEHGGFSQTISKNFRADANVSSVDQGLARPSSAPASVEPSQAPYSKSYVELMAMIQRGEKPPGIKDVNDKPPNPNQPPSNPRLQPRPKPWEAIQAQNSISKHDTHLQNFQVANSSTVKDGVKPVGNGFSNIQPKTTNTVTIKTPENHEVWWRTKKIEPDLKPDSGPFGSNVAITEVESSEQESIGHEVLSGNLAHATAYDPDGSLHVSRDRTWVPPPPPAVAMPQAAEAIWHPKINVKNEDVDVATEIPDRSGSVLMAEPKDDQFRSLGTVIEQEEQHISPSSNDNKTTESSGEDANQLSAVTEESSYESRLYKDVVKEGVEEKEDIRAY